MGLNVKQADTSMTSSDSVLFCKLECVEDYCENQGTFVACVVKAS
jgi:hypothetical protein